VRTDPLEHVRRGSAIIALAAAPLLAATAFACASSPPLAAIRPTEAHAAPPPPTPDAPRARARLLARAPHESPVVALAWAARGERVVSLDERGGLAVTDLTGLVRTFVSIGGVDRFRRLDVVDDRYVVTASQRDFDVVDLATDRRILGEYVPRFGGRDPFAVSTESARVAFIPTHAQSVLRVVDIATGATRETSIDGADIRQLVFADEGRRLWLVRDARVAMLDSSNLTEVGSIAIDHERWFETSGGHSVSSERDGQIVIRDALSGEQTEVRPRVARPMNEHPIRADLARVSPDGSRVAFARGASVGVREESSLDERSLLAAAVPPPFEYEVHVREDARAVIAVGRFGVLSLTADGATSRCGAFTIDSHTARLVVEAGEIIAYATNENTERCDLRQGIRTDLAVRVLDRSEDSWLLAPSGDYVREAYVANRLETNPRAPRFRLRAARCTTGEREGGECPGLGGSIANARVLLFAGQKAEVFDRASERSIRRFDLPDAESFELVADGRTVLAVARESVRLIDIDSGEERLFPLLRGSPRVASTRDRVLIGRELVDARDGRVVAEIEGTGFFSGPGRWIFAESDVLRVHDARDGSLRRAITIGPDWIGSIGPDALSRVLCRDGRVMLDIFEPEVGVRDLGACEAGERVMFTHEGWIVAGDRLDRFIRPSDGAWLRVRVWGGNDGPFLVVETAAGFLVPDAHVGDFLFRAEGTDVAPIPLAESDGVRMDDLRELFH